MNSPRPAAWTAPAKLNLFLDVGAQRPDGYHELETLFVPLDFGDQVRVGVTPLGRSRVRLRVTGPRAQGVPLGEENLAHRAAKAFLQQVGPAARRVDIDLELEKHLPAGAGLGGGSSDAAAVLRALAALLPNAPDAQRLLRLAMDLGADVPFFLHGGAAIGRGRGDVLEPLGPHDPLTFVLLLAPFSCSTARVFAEVGRGLRPAPAGGLRAACDALRAGDPVRIREAHFNALALPALRAYPELLRLARDAEVRLGRPPALSGSGSTLYDVVHPSEVEQVLEAWSDLPGERRVVRA